MKIDEFIEVSKNVKSIEAVSDFYIPETDGYVVSGDEMAMTKSFLKELTKFSIAELENEPEKASLIGVLIGSHDERPFILRKTLKSQTETDLKNEIDLCHKGLTVNPKCPGAFARIRELLLNFKSDTQLIKQEYEFCNFLTPKRPRNYLLWTHRIWLYDNFPHEIEDISWIQNWTQIHPSDSSAYSYYQHIMPKTVDALMKELQTNTKNLFEFPGHETLWSFRKFLINSLSSAIKIPNDWIHFQSIPENPEYPEVLLGSMITGKYIEMAQKYSINLSLIMEEYSIPEEFKFNLSNEDLVVQLALSDDYPTEFQSQQLAAKRYYKWIHTMF